MSIKITKEEILKLQTEVCVQELECTHTRKCGWRGLETQMGVKRIDSVESVMVCPRCGNNEVYIAYIPIHKAISKYAIGE